MGRLFIKHYAGKCTEHGPLYQGLLAPLRNLPIRLLEIGVNKGGSLRAFAEFLPEAELFAIDRNIKCTSDVAEVFYGNQEDKDFLKTIVDKIGFLDFIIDDGGHKADQQQESFKAFWPILKPGGCYVIEDLFVARAPNFVIDGYPSTLDFVRTLDVQPEFHRCQGFDEDICVLRRPL